MHSSSINSFRHTSTNINISNKCTLAVLNLFTKAALVIEISCLMEWSQDCVQLLPETAKTLEYILMD